MEAYSSDSVIIKLSCATLPANYRKISEFIHFHSYDNGTLTFYDENGLIHNVNGPAIVNANMEIWCYHGVIHRQQSTDCDEPSIIIRHETAIHQEWWFHGLRSRLGGKPAVLFANGDKIYYTGGLINSPTVNGVLIPAISSADYIVYFTRGLINRDFGPAVITQKFREYWKDGHFIKKVANYSHEHLSRAHC